MGCGVAFEPRLGHSIVGPQNTPVAEHPKGVLVLARPHRQHAQFLAAHRLEALQRRLELHLPRGHGFGFEQLGQFVGRKRIDALLHDPEGGRAQLRPNRIGQVGALFVGRHAVHVLGDVARQAEATHERGQVA